MLYLFTIVDFHEYICFSCPNPLIHLVGHSRKENHILHAFEFVVLLSFLYVNKANDGDIFTALSGLL